VRALGDLAVSGAVSDANGDRYTWRKVTNPGTGWLASKTSWTAADNFDSGWEVNFSGLVPVGTKAVRCFVLIEDTSASTSTVFWRKANDSNISNTPNASGEVSHRFSHHYDSSHNYYGYQMVLWLSDDYKVDFAVSATSVDLYIAYPMEVLL
jgi:hypothetical protein